MSQIAVDDKRREEKRREEKRREEKRRQIGRASGRERVWICV
jgi:hypothetical protein